MSALTERDYQNQTEQLNRQREDLKDNAPKIQTLSDGQFDCWGKKKMKLGGTDST